jgi:hypothetical protein
VPSKYANETPAQKFQRLASARLGKALDALDRLAQCGRSRAMTHTPEQAQTIANYLVNAVKSVQAAMEPQAAGSKESRKIEL